MTLPLEYPRVRNQVNNPGPDSLRNYQMHDQQGHAHEAYVVAIDRGSLGDFYDVQGTTWQDPPILRNPSQTVRIGSRTYGLYYAADNLRMVAWRDGPAVYWIENSLTNAVPPAEMLAMAEQTRPVSGSGSTAVAQTHPRNFVLPKRTAVNQGGAVQTIGGILGILVLVGIALLLGRWNQRRRSIKRLRADLEELAAAEARIQRRLAVMRTRRPQRPTVKR
ncbi:MAG: hypothetical protein JOZ73_01355 [Solirubrobacterales bacterium]|nr:hypothetical protein [Solirubrobacterales bacterium]